MLKCVNKYALMGMLAFVTNFTFAANYSNNVDY